MRVCLSNSGNGNGVFHASTPACESMAEALSTTRDFLLSIEQSLDIAVKTGHGIQEIANKTWESLLLMVLINSRRCGLYAQAQPLLKLLEDAWKTHVADLDDETHVDVLKALGALKNLTEAFQRLCNRT